MNEQEWIRNLAKQSQMGFWPGLILSSLIMFLNWKAFGTQWFLVYLGIQLVGVSSLLFSSVSVLSREVIRLQKKIEDLEGRIP